MSDKARSSDADREAPGVATWPVLITVIGFLVFVSVSLVALRIYYASDVSGPVVIPPRPYPEPQLQVNPNSDRDRLQAEQRAHLTGYTWTDRNLGVVRIPIDRAMELIAARGTDGYAPLDPPSEVPPAGVPEKRP